MPGFWIGVASAEHVAHGVAGGFCQLCHGQMRAVRRLSPGDWIAYYAPRTRVRGGEPVQAFTAIGQVLEGEPYAVNMGGGFVPARRRVAFLPCVVAPIRPLIPRLGFIRDKAHWGVAFRFGMLAVTPEDFGVISAAMAVARK